MLWDSDGNLGANLMMRRDYGRLYQVWAQNWREVIREVGIRELCCVWSVTLKRSLFLWNMRDGQIKLTSYTGAFGTQELNYLWVY